MNRFIQWHKDKMNDLAHSWGLSAYQVTWIAFLKGAVIGYLVGVYL